MTPLRLSKTDERCNTPNKASDSSSFQANSNIEQHELPIPKWMMAFLRAIVK